MSRIPSDFEIRFPHLYYHGGAPGLSVGSHIEPPSKTKAPSLSDYGAAGIHRRDRVYCTTDPTQALMYACGHPSGQACRVAPLTA